uniref:Uncharacterized protein n=1 Tax=Manihot esculenta TaxID=3983 RepID=A0A199U9Y3_MANES
MPIGLLKNQLFKFKHEILHQIQLSIPAIVFVTSDAARLPIGPCDDSLSSRTTGRVDGVVLTHRNFTCIVAVNLI